MKRRILLILAAAGCCAQASVTKVGNGDDGADLEALTPIVSGEIFKTRELAIVRLKNLNVAGVPGLGYVLPELQNSQILMASSDSHPTVELEGAIENSDGRDKVFARTFAEPYAATRFFPAAKSLTTEQLIALHIHEALHRALPADIRENEDVVMQITMAIASPGANYDRIRQVASLYLKNSAGNVAQITTSQSGPRIPRGKPSKSKFGYEFISYQNGTFGSVDSRDLNWHGLEYATSLGGLQSVGPLTFEPYLRARMRFRQEQSGPPNMLGPSAFDLAAKFKKDNGAEITPFVRFTAKSLLGYLPAIHERDIWTFGLSYTRQGPGTYFGGQVFYSAASTSYETRNIQTHFGPILSLTSSAGWINGRWRFGGMGELHSSGGNKMMISDYVPTADKYEFQSWSITQEPFRVLSVSPELAYIASRFEVKAAYRLTINENLNDYSDMGDIVDRGIGERAFTLNLTAVF